MHLSDYSASSYFDIKYINSLLFFNRCAVCITCWESSHSDVCGPSLYRRMCPDVLERQENAAQQENFLYVHPSVVNVR